MKKLLALILAVVMAASLSVVGLAEDEPVQSNQGEDTPAIIIGNAAPGGTIEIPVSINYQTANQMIGLSYHSVEEIRTLSFKDKQMIAEERNGKIRIRPAIPRYETTDVATSLTDTLVVTLADDTVYEFPVEMSFTAEPFLDFVEIEGHPGKDLHSEFLLGDTYPYVFELFDKANRAKEISEVSVSFTEEPYDPDASDIVEVGETEIRGKQVVIPITPARTGRAYMSASVRYVTEIGVYPEYMSWDMNIVSSYTNPGGSNGGSGDDKSEPSATDNIINTEETLQAIAYGDEMLELKVTNGSAGLGLVTVDTLGNYHTTLSIQNGSMRVEIPGGFGKVNEPGRIYYPMDFSDNLANAGDLAAAVKGDKAKTEVVKAGGDMVMPTTVTVTLKTKLTGTVRVYYYNEETRRYTLIASPAAQDGKVTFATKQMGVMVLTTGTI